MTDHALRSRVFMTGDPTAFWVDAAPTELHDWLVEALANGTPFIPLLTTPYASGAQHTVFVKPAAIAAIAPIEPDEVAASCADDVDDEEDDSPCR